MDMCVRWKKVMFCHHNLLDFRQRPALGPIQHRDARSLLLPLVLRKSPSPLERFLVIFVRQVDKGQNHLLGKIGVFTA